MVNNPFRYGVGIAGRTLQGTKHIPQKWHFESMMFLFPFGGICDRSLEGSLVILP